uniref:WW domain binding protein 11 n=1 Tax=Periophthalmus magnuspinnatus TaxID=409849 RepID=A0A3B4A5I0_9GOBI
FMRPPGMPRPMAPPMSMFPPPLNTNVLSAPPSIVQRQKAPGSTGQDAPQTATISAKPQIINPKAEVTRFVPTALRVRRDKIGPGAGAGPVDKGPGGMVGAVAPPNMKTKDQVYEAFMREMEGLL